MLNIIEKKNKWFLDKLNYLRISRNLTNQQIADKFGFSVQNLSKLEKIAKEGKTSIGDNTIIQMEKLFGLIFNQMDEIIEPNAKIHIDNNELMKVPCITTGIKAGHMDGSLYFETDEEPYETAYRRDGNYLAFKIDGDSMEPKLMDGDKILCKELPKIYWQKRIFKDVFIVLHKEGALCKYIKDHNMNENKICLHSFNSYYPDFWVELKDVDSLWYWKETNRTTKIW